MSLLSRQRHNSKPQRRTVPLEGLQVNLLVVRGAVLPAAVEDSDPLVGERANGGVMVRATLPLLLVVGPCPERLLAGGRGEFMEALAHELGASHPPMHPLRLAAFLGHWSHAGEFLDVLGAVVALTVRTKGGGQTRRQGLPGPRQS